jgi:beta-galactosidase
MRFFAILLCLFSSAAFANDINDLMYPPAPAAEKAIKFDGQSFIINGKRTYIASGSLHYARVPHELWRDRLLRMKRAGFNCVETYAFWNFHEPRENEWNFSGDRDIGAFLDTAKELGLYAIVRAGPYVCAEWDSGGYPIWLKFKPPMKVRTADPEYLKWNDHWYDRILPVVAAHQIHKGGNVIMVQLENEHPRGWGAVDGDPYFDHLRKKAVELGIEVPYFFSGLNHGNGPWPRSVAGRTTPWFTTEFWPGWFDLYGNLPAKRFHEVERDNWRILAHGGAGHNFYMLHGGSNFATWNDDSGAASYDYGAAIGQCGDLRPIYYRMKRANYLAQLLPAMREAGAKIEFDGNSAKSFENAPVVPNVKLDNCNVRILAAVTYHDVKWDFEHGIQGDKLRLGINRTDEKSTTLVVYGSPGETGKLDFGDKQVTVRFPEDAPQTYDVATDSYSVRVVAMNNSLADRTWIVKNYVVCGPAFVTDSDYVDKKLTLTIERPYGQPSCSKVIVYGEKVQQFAVKANMSLDTAPAPKLENWQSRTSPEASTDFGDSKWKASENPQQMGADGDTSAFTWYRATVDVKKAGRGRLDFGRYADNIVVLVNGKPFGEAAEFHAGRNMIAVLASHRGRQKAFNYLGTLDNFYRKGLFSPVRLDIGGEKINVKGWKMRGGAGAIDGDWQPAAPSGGVPSFSRATFKDKPVPGRVLRLVTKPLSRGAAWLNGHNLGRYPEKIPCSGMYLPECWLKEGENTIVIFDEKGASPAEVKLEIDRAASREVITVSEPCDASVPLVVPKDELQAAKLNFATKDNLAFKKPAAASSSENGNPPDAACDGDAETRWCAAGGNTPQWWRVDLRKAYNLNGCEILWENEARYQYIVEGSPDLKTWSTLSDQRQTRSTTPLQKLAFKASGVRYVRITITRLPSQPATWASICEVKVTEEASPASGVTPASP